MIFDEVKLSEVASYISRGITPSYTEDNGIMVINQKCIRNGALSLRDARMHNTGKKKVPSEKTIKRWDILVNSTGTGTLGRVAQVTDEVDATVDSHVTIVRPNDNIDPLFLGYAVKWRQPYIEALAEGSTGQTELSRHRLADEITIPLPPITIQRQIGALLFNIDCKISLNQKINDNLQQQAQALFVSWFVDYAPWNGERPTSWVSATLGDFVEIKRGGSPRPIQDYLSDTGLRWLKISDVTSLRSPFVADIKEHIKESGLRKTVLLKSGSLVLSNSATPGIPKMLDVDSCIHDGWLYFPKSQFSKYYLYLFFNHIRKQLVALGNGSVFTNLKTDILKQFPSVMPDASVLADFDAIVTPLFEGMLNADRENTRLVGIRDALLPRLMSGEIDVSDLNA